MVNPATRVLRPKLDFTSPTAWADLAVHTIQLDMQMPERFELEYDGRGREKHRPIMIHRALLGSRERFIGVITEHFGRRFPTCSTRTVEAPAG